MKSFRIILLLSLFGMSSLAETGDYDLLKLHAKVLPRIIQMTLPTDVPENAGVLCLLYEPVDYDSASVLQKLLKESVLHAPGQHLEIKKRQYSRWQECAGTQALFLFNTDIKTVHSVLKTIGRGRVFVAGYNAQMLQEGVDYSIYIGRAVHPYLNLQTLKAKGIVPKPLLLRISKVYQPKDVR